MQRRYRRDRTTWTFYPSVIEQMSDDDSDSDNDTLVMEEEEVLPVRRPTPFPYVDPRPQLDEEDEMVECCICFETKRALLNSSDDFTVAVLSDLDMNYRDQDACIVANCYQHYHCIPCLRRISVPNQIQGTHPINRRDPLIKCQFPFQEGSCVIGDMPHYFSHHDMAKILAVDEFRSYEAHAMRFAFPGYEMIPCPRCQVTNVLPSEKLDASARGSMIITCVQNPTCQHTFCYHCQKPCTMICFPCRTHRQHNDPESFNHFLFKAPPPPPPTTDIEDSDTQLFLEISAWAEDILRENRSLMTFSEAVNRHKPQLYKNKELTLEIVLEAIDGIMTSFDEYFKCPLCLVTIEKTEKCSAIEHCHWERCYSCGYISYPNGTLLDHWSERGKNGCPRFDNAQAWKELNDTPFLCIEGICYGHDEGQCTIDTHQPGILAFKVTRQRAFLYHLIMSLPDGLRATVLDHPMVTSFEPLKRVDFNKALVDSDFLRDYLWVLN